MRYRAKPIQSEVKAWNDPKTAPLIPVCSTLSVEREVFEIPNDETGVVEASLGKTAVSVEIRAWDRSTDSIVEYRVAVEDIENADVTRRTRGLDDDDKDWLRMIGARL